LPTRATAVGRGQSAQGAGRSNAGRERRERRRGGEALVAHVAIGRRHPAEEDSDSTHVRREGERRARRRGGGRRERGSRGRGLGREDAREEARRRRDD